MQRDAPRTTERSHARREDGPCAGRDDNGRSHTARHAGELAREAGEFERRRGGPATPLR